MQSPCVGKAGGVDSPSLISPTLTVHLGNAYMPLENISNQGNTGEIKKWCKKKKNRRCCQRNLTTFVLNSVGEIVLPVGHLVICNSLS